ncbi:bifunctional precorrin-2 dehydrogenase/sirohydrochlorin ferrochelatase [Novosphingobium sp.]|uniref:precorrin-2 dehydrogenase/sirohydrochlorin ferrochelatase family protein n=1 Tax=Novosphingobium sp. TaxID=1874826 RepID=UPI001EC35AE1|nr:bifunctional precorrin-2 dehydrogenase/sirohydrochlorin ferrochelatase [Novosphingobium sp.]MBK9011286.1 bifunctional precorrin-2 dehydrogenase/sirohydrochlorin ferrochelatase [Novosphingobium sp.]
MHSLPLFHRISGRPVIVAGEGDMGEAKARLVERAGGLVVGPDNPEARLAFVAMAEPDELAARLKARGLLVNVADRPDLCDFTLPSVLERGDVLVAVSTGGASAGLAKVLRLRLEALLPASLGALATALAGARGAMRARWADAGERRRALDAALAEGGPLDPLAPHDEGAVASWLAGGAAGHGGTVEFTLASDDPDDLTLRQARWLGSADRVFYSPGVPAAVLTRARADAVQRELGSEPPAPADGLTVIIRRG